MSIPKPGDVINDTYLVLRRLGEGGMSTVYEVERIRDHALFAIKWVHTTLPGRPAREFEAVTRINHPNVIRVYEVQRTVDAMFLVMERFAGETLSAFLAHEQVTLAHLIALLTSAMSGVAAAHASGVIHRDIKPDNIFLASQIGSEWKIPKVLDFGIAKLMDASGLHTGYAVGTPLFMSLEQLRMVADVDRRADVYGFAVILYVAMTGRFPFVATNIPDLATSMMGTVPIPPHVLEPRMPRELSQIVVRALAPDRDQRTPSLEQLMAELAPFAIDSASDTHLGRGECSPATEPAKTRLLSHPHAAGSDDDDVTTGRARQHDRAGRLPAATKHWHPASHGAGRQPERAVRALAHKSAAGTRFPWRLAGATVSALAVGSTGWLLSRSASVPTTPVMASVAAPLEAEAPLSAQQTLAPPAPTAVDAEQTKLGRAEPSPRPRTDAATRRPSKRWAPSASASSKIAGPADGGTHVAQGRDEAPARDEASARDEAPIRDEAPAPPSPTSPAPTLPSSAPPTKPPVPTVAPVADHGAEDRMTLDQVTGH